MGPSRRVPLGAAALISVVMSLGTAAPSGAQYSPVAQSATRGAGFSTGLFARSPSLAGMGQLTLVGDDPHHRITMWDFAGNPTGVALAESTTTLDLRPGAAGASDVRDLSGSPAGQIRQTFAAHAGTLGYEVWRRLGRMAYGAIGEVGSLQLDRPYNDDVEHRVHVSAPWATPVLNGVMPFTRSGRTRYALDLRWAQETVDSRYLTVVRNAAGEFISLDSEEQKSPVFMVPEVYDIRQLGGGGAISHVLASWLTGSVGYEGVAVRIDGDNTDNRNVAQTHEVRPYNVGEATLIGRIGRHVEWGVDGRGWRSTSETRWNFSISAGQGVAPLSGRGKMQDRHEEGTSMRARALWHAGALDFGAGWNTDYRKVQITPPPLADQTSFNYFLNTVSNRLTADSLALADSVVSDVAQLHGWEAGGGVALRLPKQRGLVGIEYHRGRQLEQNLTSGVGPRRIVWDVRGGLDYRLMPTLSARAGYQFRWDDRDDYTQANEYRSHLATMGIGLAPRGSLWKLDLSYGVRWLRADYGAPSQPRGTRQQMLSQIHWAF